MAHYEGERKMNALNARDFERELKDRCCSQTVASLCLEDMNKENEELITSMVAFCNDMGRGKICGALAAAVAVLNVVDPNATINEAQTGFMDWFEDQFGGYDCNEIIGEDPLLKQDVCPRIVLETYLKLRGYIYKAN
jgi:hypothetical protein